MSQSIDLKQIERKAYTSFFRDGLWDIFLGLLLLAMGIHTLANQTAVYVALVAFAVAVPWVGRRIITTPRLGHVKYGPARKSRLKTVTVALSISALSGVALLAVIAAGTDVPAIVIGACAGVMFLVVFSLMAYYMDFDRLYLYGLLFSTSFAVALMLDDPAPTIAFLISAGIALLIGAVVLSRFLLNYPEVEERQSDDS